MEAYVIDGLFLTQKITGIQRYAYEITMELDKIVLKNTLEILVPESFENIPDLKNIKVVRYGKNMECFGNRLILHAMRECTKCNVFALRTFCRCFTRMGLSRFTM